MTTMTARATARMEDLGRRCEVMRTLLGALREDYRFSRLAEDRLTHVGASDWRFSVRSIDRFAGVIDAVSDLVEDVRPRIERRVGIRDTLARRMIASAVEISKPGSPRLTDAERKAFACALVDGAHPFMRWRRMVAWYVEAAEALCCTRRNQPYVLLGEADYFDPSSGGYPGCGAAANVFRLAYDLAITDAERALVAHAVNKAITAALKGAVRK